ncbi:MAG: T9SS type A sorting domain-containing protein [Candidatus Cloacimonetes bacterium]|nr:T9SS type A sorting domain-containing protein [Candidatus Cloacimonadota bacterium]
MKYSLIILLILCLFYSLKSQVDFQYQFSMEGSSSTRKFRYFSLLDINNDGEEEICLISGHNRYNTINNPPYWKISFYSLNGEELSIYEQEIDREAHQVYRRGKIFENDDEKYLVNVFTHRDSTNPMGGNVYLDLCIYNLESIQLIDSLSIFLWPEDDDIDGTSIDITCIAPVLIDNIIVLHFGAKESQYFPGLNYYFVNSTSNKYTFDGDSLAYLETLDGCGKNLYNYDNFDYIISTSYHMSGNDSYPGGPSENTDYHLKLITKEYTSQVFDIFQISGSSDPEGASHNPVRFAPIASNVNDYANEGMIIYYYLIDTDEGHSFHIKRYSPDFSEVLWERTNTNLDPLDIRASTCVTVNGQDHYMMYFDDNQLEIRNRNNGGIVYNQDLEITPKYTMKTSDGELLFITENDSIFNVYTLASEIEVPDEIDNDHILSTGYQLQNFPNPFNPETEISFYLEENSQVSMEIYNIKGQKVNSLGNGEFNSGYHSLNWQGNDESGNLLGSGIYFYLLKVNGEAVSVRKCTLIK